MPWYACRRRRAPSMVVYSVTLCASAEVRIERESAMAGRFSSTVLTISTISLFLIMSTMCGRPSVDLVHQRHRNAGRLDRAARAARGQQGEAQLVQFARHFHRLGLVAGLDADEHLARLRAAWCRRRAAT